jgi:predicted nucleic acid-binding protein
MDFVADCSVIASIFLPDEQDEIALAVLKFMEKKQVVVPAVFHWEIANVFHVAVKRGRCSSEQVTAMVAQLAKFPIISDVVPDVYEINELLALSRKYNLSAYDAAYLRTAKRYNVSLITLDKALRDSAKKEGLATSC